MAAKHMFSDQVFRKGLMHERPVDPDLVYKTGTQA
jgi:hypothetical protein